MIIAMVPFSVKADTISNTNLKGYSSHIELIDQGVVSNVVLNGSSINTVFNNYTLCVNGILDDEYIGYANILITYYIPNSIVYDSTDQKYHYASDDPSYYRTVSHYVYINGNSFDWYDSTGVRFRNDTGISFNAAIQSISISTSNVVQSSTIDSLDQIIDILSDINLIEEDIQGISSDMLLELQSIDDRLSNIENFKYYYFPVESLPFISNVFLSGNDIDDIFGNGFYTYPLFSLSNGDKFCTLRLQKKNLGIDRNRIILFANSYLPSANVFYSDYDITFSYTYLN